ncbi:MAG TPA: hypothetical protein ENI42_05355, partial [Thermoplasmatales archaeon]|nr:hypothetical protein [Thermoplasmatales archaeon]
MKLIKKHPRTASLPLIQHLIKRLEPYKTTDNDNEIDSQGKNKDTPDNEKSNNNSQHGEETDSQEEKKSAADNEKNDSGSQQENKYNKGYNLSHTDTVSTTIVYPQNASEIWNQSEMKKKDYLNVSDNITLIPREGHFIFIGRGSAEFNLVFNYSNIVITITSYLSIKENSSVDVKWDTDSGYFEIAGNGTFKMTNFYFNAGNVLMFSVSSLCIVGDGYILFSRQDDIGKLYLDRVSEVEDLFLDTSIENANVSMGGSLLFSSNSDAHNFSINWDKKSLSINGSFNNDLYIGVQNFYMLTPNFDIGVELLSLHHSLTFEFNDAGGSTGCIVSSHKLDMYNISLSYGSKSTFLDHVTVDGTLNVSLQITSNPDISADDGHISITGSAMMNVDTTFDLNGTVVELKGIFGVESVTDRIDIWWNKTRDYFHINCTSRFVARDLYIGIEPWLHIRMKSVTVSYGGYMTIITVGNEARIMFGAGATETIGKGFDCELSLENYSLSLGVENIYLLSTTVFYAVEKGDERYIYIGSGVSLVLQGLDITFSEFTVRAEGLAIEGSLEASYDVTTYNLSLHAMGAARLVDLYVGTRPPADENERTYIESAYLSMVAEVNILVEGNVTEIFVAGGGVLQAGYSPLGPFSISIVGYVHMTWYMEEARAYGEFGFMSGVRIAGINVRVDGTGYFVMENETFQVWSSGHIHISGGGCIYFSIDNLRIIVPFHFHADGVYGAYAEINFATGDFYAAVGGALLVCVFIDDVYIKGENIDIDSPDWSKLGITQNSLLYFIHIKAKKIDVHLHSKPYETGFAFMIGFAFAVAGNLFGESISDTDAGFG